MRPHAMKRPPAPSFNATGYCGWRTESGTVVVRCAGTRREDLHWRLDLFNHSPSGLEWGYGGSGPAQLALALLADATDAAAAVSLYQRFKQDVVMALPFNGWVLTAVQIHEWLDQHRAVLCAAKDIDEEFDKVVEAEYDLDDGGLDDAAEGKLGLVSIVDQDGAFVLLRASRGYAEAVCASNPNWKIVPRLPR